MSKSTSCPPANLHVTIPLKQRQKPQMGRLQESLAPLACHVPLTIEAVGDCMASEHQVNQVLAAVTVRCYEAGLRLVHVLFSLPAEACRHG